MNNNNLFLDKVCSACESTALSILKLYLAVINKNTDLNKIIVKRNRDYVPVRYSLLYDKRFKLKHMCV